MNSRKIITYGQFVLLVFIAFTLSGCHSNYVMLSYNIKSEGVWNRAKTEIIFVGQVKAYQKASGISSIPDGGQVKILYNKVNLYNYYPASNKLSILADLTDLPRSNYFAGSFFSKDSLVYYEHYVINIRSGEIAKIDSAVFLLLKKNISGNEGISSYNLKKKIANVQISEWGLKLQEILPKSDDAYINDLIHWEKGGSTITRKAIIEQIITKKSKKDIMEILIKMEEYGDNFDGYEKSLFEKSFEESKQYLNEILIKKRG
jgi:hypothetical protein